MPPSVGQHPTTIDDLPPEVLSCTFLNALSLCHSTGVLYAPPFDIIALSRVSTKWRRTSLALQALWGANLPLMSLKWTRLCLERCKTAPFDLFLDYSALEAIEEYRAAARLLYPHLPRARVLHLYNLSLNAVASEIKREIFAELCSGLQGHMLMNAIELEIRVAPASDVEPTFIDSGMLLGPVQLRNLRRLRLSNIIHTLDSPCGIFSFDLRVLKLVDCRIWQTVDEMITILQSVPALEILQYGNSTEDYFTQPFEPTPSHTHSFACIRLQHLRLLRCFGSGMFAHHLAIFSYLDFPSNAELHLEGYNIWGAELGSWTSFQEIVGVASSLLKKHFATAIDYGAYYPAIRLSDLEITTLSQPVTVAGSVTALDVLPRAIRVSVPWIEGENVALKERPRRDRLLGLYTALPIFALATELTFEDNISQYTAGLLMPFPHVRVLRLNFNSLSFIVFCIENKEKHIFPDLEHVSIACSKRRFESMNLIEYGYVAKGLADIWGAATLRTIELQDTRFLGDAESTVVSAFRDALGAGRVRLVRGL